MPPSVGLDILGGIPGLGNLVQGTVAGAKVIKAISGVFSVTTVKQGGRVVDGVLAYGGGIYSAYSSAGEEDALNSLIGAGSAGAGIGLALAGQTLGEGAKGIPIAGNILSGTMGAEEDPLADLPLLSGRRERRTLHYVPGARCLD